MTFESAFGIGEKVEFRVIQATPMKAFVRAVTFTNAKVRYALFVSEAETTLHNVDSTFVHAVTGRAAEFMEFGPDNYS